MIKRLVNAALFFVFIFYVAKSAHESSARLKAAKNICNLVYQKYYEKSELLGQWHEDCLQKVNKFSLFTSKNKIVTTLQTHLLQMGVSHLFFYEPEAEQYLWKGVDRTNGLRVRYIEGTFVVYEVLKDSPAEKSDFKVGDIIKSINSENLLDENLIERSAGDFYILRKDQELVVHTTTRAIKLNDQPRVTEITNETAILKIFNFRAEHFEKSAWLEIANGIKKYKKVIIDLRGNPGGNFVAMLRALSTFVCSKSHVGSLKSPRNPSAKKSYIEDDLDDSKLLQILEESNEVKLETFANTTCFDGSVVTLIDSNTASVAEIMAHALRSHNRSKLYGERSSGQVLLSVWYPQPEFGKNYSLSIPESVYETETGDRYEGFGVVPDKYLKYELQDAINGKDSWIF